MKPYGIEYRRHHRDVATGTVDYVSQWDTFNKYKTLSAVLDAWREIKKRNFQVGCWITFGHQKLESIYEYRPVHYYDAKL